MRIPLQHLQGLVPRDGGHLHRVQPLLKQPGGRLMPQIMEGQALNPGGLAEDRRPPPTAPEKPPIFDDASSKVHD